MTEKGFLAGWLDHRFVTVEVAPDALPDAIAGMRAMGFRGAAIADPHKVAVVELLDAISDEARWVGAVNCVYRDADDRYLGENTDGKGCLAALREIAPVENKSAVVTGAGVTARAAAVELARAGVAEITVVNRSTRRGQQLADLLDEQLNITAMFFPWSGRYEVPAETGIVVHAAAIPEEPSRSDPGLNLDALEAGTVVADMRITQPRTAILEAAAQRGCTTVNGLDILVRQTGICFNLWTGLDPDYETMREALEEFLEL